MNGFKNSIFLSSTENCHEFKASLGYIIIGYSELRCEEPSGPVIYSIKYMGCLKQNKIQLTILEEKKIL